MIEKSKNDNPPQNPDGILEMQKGSL